MRITELETKLVQWFRALKTNTPQVHEKLTEIIKQQNKRGIKCQYGKKQQLKEHKDS